MGLGFGGSGTAVTFMLRDYCWGDMNEKEREELPIPSLSSTLEFPSSVLY